MLLYISKGADFLVTLEILYVTFLKRLSVAVEVKLLGVTGCDEFVISVMLLQP